MPTEVEGAFLSHSDPLGEWDGFVERAPQGAVFCRSSWLHAVAPGGFEILVLRRSGAIVAGLPLVTTRRWGFHFIHMPKLTQTLGPVIAPSASESREGRLSHEMALLESLVGALPHADYVTVNLDPRCANWLPFHWAGFRQTSLCTYVLPDLADLDAVFSGFAHMKRKNVKRAQKVVEVREDLDAAQFHAFHSSTLAQRGRTISYRLDLLRRIMASGREGDGRKTWYAVDAAGHMHAAIVVVWDPKSAYYLLSAIDPRYVNSGASTLLVWHAIRHVAGHTREFNFEGSMVRGVEHSFRKFGAVQVPYSQVSRVPSWLAGQAVAWRRRLRRRRSAMDREVD